MNDAEKKEIKRSYSTSNFLKKDNKQNYNLSHNNHQYQNENPNLPSMRYMDGLVKHSQPPTLTYNQSVTSLQKSDENVSENLSTAFKNVDTNIMNGKAKGIGGLHYHTPSMDKELKTLTQKLALERCEIEQELKKTQSEVIKWKDKYEFILKNLNSQNRGNPHFKSVSSLQDNESIMRSQSDLSGIGQKNFNDSTNSLFNNGQGNITKSQISERDVKLLAQKFALERVEMEGMIKGLQNKNEDKENLINKYQQENENLSNMCREIQKEKELEITHFKKKLSENENELKKNVQQEFMKLKDAFDLEKTAFERKQELTDDEMESLKRENQILVDTIHSLNAKNKAQNELIQNLNNNKSESTLLFSKVNQLEQELFLITEQLQQEQENKQALTNRFDTERYKADFYLQQLEDQKKMFEKEHIISKQLRDENERYQEQLELNGQQPSNLMILYEEEQEKNQDLYEQNEEQAEMINQLKEQVQMLEELNKNLSSKNHIDSQNFEILKNELNLKSNEYRCKMLEEYLHCNQVSFEDQSKQIKDLNTQLANKSRELTAQSEKLEQLDFLITENANKNTNFQEIIDLKSEVYLLQNKLKELNDDNSMLREQKLITEDTLRQLRLDQINKNNDSSLQQKNNEQTTAKIIELLQLLEEKDDQLQSLQAKLRISDSQQLKKMNMETEKSETSTRNLDTMYEQKILQIQQNSILEEEKLTNMIQTKNSEIKGLQSKIDEYLRKIEIFEQQNETMQRPSYTQNEYGQQSTVYLEEQLKQTKKDLDEKSNEYVKLLAQQSQQLVASFQKDNIINSKTDQILLLSKKISALEDEKSQLKQKLEISNPQQNDQTPLNEQISYYKNEIQSQSYQIYKQNETIKQQRNQIEQFERNLQQNESRLVKEISRAQEIALTNSNSNSVSSLDGVESQTEKLKKQIFILTQLVEQREQSLKQMSQDQEQYKKQLQEMKEKCFKQESSIKTLQKSLEKSSDLHPKQQNRTSGYSSQESSNENYFPSNTLQVSKDPNFEIYKQEVENQKQIYLKQIKDLTSRVEMLQADKVCYSQERERFNDTLKQKEKHIEIFREEIKRDCQQEFQANVKNLTQNFLNEKIGMEERIKSLEQENSLLKSEQSVIVDETVSIEKKNIEWEKEVRKNVENEIRQLAQKYLQQKCIYENIIAELKIQLGTLQQQMQEYKELAKLNENYILQTSENDKLNRLIETKNSENKSLQIRLEATERQKNEEIKKLKREIQKIHEENLDKSSFEVYAERIGYLSAIQEYELKIKDLESLIELHKSQLQVLQNSNKYNSLDFLQQVQSRNAWQQEFSRLLEELKSENKQLNQNIFEQQQTIAKLQLQNASLIISDSYYIIQK